MAEIWIEFSAGRRGAGSIDCLICGTAIHQRTNDPAAPWYDGHGDTRDYSVPSGGGLHEHEPAKEIGPTLGPFSNDYVQFTYDALTHESETIAYFDRDRGDWIIVEPWTGAGEAYSDITIQARGA